MNKYKKVEEIINKRSITTNNINSFGYRGVSKYENNSNKFNSSFGINHKGKSIKIHLGSYNTPEEAYIARLKFIDSLK